MKTQLLLTAALLLSILLESACSAATIPAPRQSTSTPVQSTPTSQPSAAIPLPVTGLDPVMVIRSYVDTENTGDFDQTLAFYADDAVINSLLGVFIGKQEIAKFLEQDVKTTRAKPDTTAVQGPFVIDTGTVSLARFQQAGINEVKYRSEYIVGKDGKIHFFSPSVLLTPDQETMWKAALAKAGPPPTPSVDPIEVAQSYVQAANLGNFAKALSYYADDAAALVQNGSLLLVGKQQIADWLKTDVQTTQANPQDWQYQGNMVINTGSVSLARFKSLGIDPVQYRAIYVIQDGKIRFFRPTAILTPDQQAKFQAAQATPAPNH